MPLKNEVDVSGLLLFKRKFGGKFCFLGTRWIYTGIVSAFRFRSEKLFAINYMIASLFIDQGLIPLSSYSSLALIKSRIREQPWSHWCWMQYCSFLWYLAANRIPSEPVSLRSRKKVSRHRWRFPWELLGNSLRHKPHKSEMSHRRKPLKYPQEYIG